jgi:hypothetical protein
MALVALIGVFLSLYLTMFKLGYIGTLACGSGSCETVQLSKWGGFLGGRVLCNSTRPRFRRRAGAIRKFGSPNEVARLRYRRWTALLTLAHVPRALRHPRAVSLVPRLSGDDAGVVRAGVVGPEEWRVASGLVKSEMRSPGNTGASF